MFVHLQQLRASGDIQQRVMAASSWEYSHGTSPEVWVWTHRPVLIHVHPKAVTDVRWHASQNPWEPSPQRSAKSELRTKGVVSSHFESWHAAIWQVAEGISAEWNENAHQWFAQCREFSAETQKRNRNCFPKIMSQLVALAF